MPPDPPLREQHGELAEPGSWGRECGSRASRAEESERVSPQNLGGHSSFLVAVNFQPMWLPQIRHWAMVQAYPGNQLCSVKGRPLRLRLEAL